MHNRILGFRSDTRHPSIILKDGFDPKTVISFESIEEWLNKLFKVVSRKQGYMLIDSNSEHCVSLSTKFEAAALFPVNEEKTTYVYVLDLPKLKKIGIDEQKITFIEKGSNLKKDSFDLHGLQAALSFQYAKKFPDEALLAAYSLYAYEAFTFNISPSNIIAAVEISRNPKLYSSLHIRYFQIKNIIFNENFKGEPAKLQEAKEYLTSFKKNKDYATTEPIYGMGGKILPNITEELTVKYQGEDVLYQSTLFRKAIPIPHVPVVKEETSEKKKELKEDSLKKKKI